MTEFLVWLVCIAMLATVMVGAFVVYIEMRHR